MSDDLSNIFNEAEKYLKTSLKRYQNHLPELMDDAIQEGMIQVWRDVEQGGRDKIHILRRAKMKSETFFKRQGEFFFGKAPASRDGLRPNNSAINKVQVFLEEYLPVHNNVWPTGAEVSRAIGLTQNSAVRALKAIREGRVDHMKYYENGRKDWDYYSTISVELLNTNTGNESNEVNWTNNPKLKELRTEFEDDLLGDMNLIDLLNKLPDRSREALYLYLYVGYIPKDLGEHFGFTAGHVSSQGGRVLDTALKQVRVLLNPYEGECASGHQRSAETTDVIRRKDGAYYRACIVCQQAKAAKTHKVLRAKRAGA